MNKTKKQIMAFILIVFSIGVIYGIYWFLYGRYHIGITDAYVAANQNQITSQVTGSIKVLNMENTQKVEKGDILAVIDDEDYKIALGSAEANLSLAVREYQTLMYSVVEAEKVLIADMSNYKNIETTYQRDTRAYSKGLISNQQLDNSRNEYLVAKSTLDRSEASLNSAKTRILGLDIYSYPPIQLAIEKYKRAYLNLKRTIIYAPVSGVLAKKSAYIGQQIGMNQNLATIINLDEIWINANIKETEMGEIKVGNIVSLKSDYNGKVYEGYIQGVSPGSGSALSLLPAQNATGNWIKIVQRVPVRVQILKESLQKNGSIPVGTSIEATVNITKNIDKIEPFIIESSNFYSLDENEVNKKVQEIISKNMFRNEE